MTWVRLIPLTPHYLCVMRMVPCPTCHVEKGTPCRELAPSGARWRERRHLHIARVRAAQHRRRVRRSRDKSIA